MAYGTEFLKAGAKQMGLGERSECDRDGRVAAVPAQNF
jgi:hypothetical protein